MLIDHGERHVAAFQPVNGSCCSLWYNYNLWLNVQMHILWVFKMTLNALWSFSLWWVIEFDVYCVFVKNSIKIVS